jgi:hypothetical protein
MTAYKTGEVEKARGPAGRRGKQETVGIDIKAVRQTPYIKAQW